MTSEELKEWREKNGLTQAKAGALIGVKGQTVRQWEAGRYYGTHKPLKIPHYIALAIAALDAGLDAYGSKNEKTKPAKPVESWESIL